MELLPMIFHNVLMYDIHVFGCNDLVNFAPVAES